MRNILRLAAAGLLMASVATAALAQSRGSTKKRPPAAPAAAASPSNPYGLANCSERPFARDCDRRGTW
ncbi:hypothetical protein [Pseudorhodoplanes sp.]|uniref:hypothetical protein n=1 Tax=Pseudorhodoplanes sp. TaxID=1934341 RepID=UPI003D0C4C63